jgi:hypothetical protein
MIAILSPKRAVSAAALAVGVVAGVASLSSQAEAAPIEPFSLEGEFNDGASIVGQFLYNTGCGVCLTGDYTNGVIDTGPPGVLNAAQYTTPFNIWLLPSTDFWVIDSADSNTNKLGILWGAPLSSLTGGGSASFFAIEAGAGVATSMLYGFAQVDKCQENERYATHNDCKKYHDIIFVGPTLMALWFKRPFRLPE